eukprot:3934686-Rhodomonas_salina.4
MNSDSQCHVMSLSHDCTPGELMSDSTLHRETWPGSVYYDQKLRYYASPPAQLLVVLASSTTSSSSNSWLASESPAAEPDERLLDLHSRGLPRLRADIAACKAARGWPPALRPHTLHTHLALALVARLLPLPLQRVERAVVELAKLLVEGPEVTRTVPGLRVRQSLGRHRARLWLEEIHALARWQMVGGAREVAVQVHPFRFKRHAASA